MIKFWIAGKLCPASNIILIAIACTAVLICSSQILSAQVTPPGNKADKPAAKEKSDNKEEEETPSEELPLLETLRLPDIDKLLKGEKEDWIVLFGGRVLKVPALQPRPDHLAWLLEQQKKMLPNRPNAAAQEKDPELLPKWLEKYKEFTFISLIYSDRETEDDYRLPVRYVDYILYHEDLALRKARQLIKQGNSFDAQRLISTVGRWSYSNNVRRKKERIAPIQWPGLLDSQRALLLLNIRQAQTSGDWERAFNLAKIHRGFDSGYDQLSRLLGESNQKIAEQAVQQGDYRKVRFFLRQLRSMYPSHPQITRWQNRLKQLSQSQVQLATKFFQEKNYREASALAQLAVQIWPYDSKNRRELSRLYEKYQTLRTGHILNDDQIKLQHRSLLNHQWFHVDKITEGYPRYRSRFIETWVPDDLGRTIRLKMKLTRQPYESRPELKSYQLAQKLTATSLTNRPQQRKLFANSIESIHVTSPDQLEIQLASQTAHPLGLFAGLLDNNSTARQTTLNNTYFRPREKSATDFVRAFPEPDNAGRFGIAEVRESTFTNKEQLLRALLRDELDYVPHLPLSYVRQLNRDQRFFVLKYHTPQVTLLQFHFHGKFSKQPALRLALLAALDRNKIKEHLAQVQGFQSAELRLTNSIAPSTSHADNQSGQVVKFDHIAARALYLILSRSQKTSPEVRLLISEDLESIRLSEFIKTQWESLGMKVKFVTPTEIKSKESATWDAAIVSHRMLAPQHDLPRLLSVDGQLTETELQSLPLPMQRSLLKLEEAHNWGEIDRSLRELQDRLVLDAWMLPLWEQNCYQAIRREIRNVPAAALRPYQNLDRWIIEPIIPAY